MNTVDYVLIIFIIIAMTAALKFIYRRRKSGGCIGCSGSCSSCEKRAAEQK